MPPPPGHEVDYYYPHFTDVKTEACEVNALWLVYRRPKLGPRLWVHAPALASGCVSLGFLVLCSLLWSMVSGWTVGLSQGPLCPVSCWNNRRSLESDAGLRPGSHLWQAGAAPWTIPLAPFDFETGSCEITEAASSCAFSCLSLPRSWGSGCNLEVQVFWLSFFKVGSTAILCPLHFCMYLRNILSISTKKNAWILLGCVISLCVDS